MNIDVVSISKEYLNYINENTKFVKFNNENVEVVTPFIDSYGESIGFNIKYLGDRYVLTDNGYTIWNLSINGINFNNSSRRKILLNSLLNYGGFNIDNKNSISKIVTKKYLGQGIHEMTQLLVNIYDFSYISPNNVKTQFLEDVEMYFLSNDDYNVFPAFSVMGKSRLEHRFNFAFSSKGNFKLARVHNSLQKQQVDNILVSWLDTVEYREKLYRNKEQLYIILSNEGYESVKNEYKSALREYGIETLNFNDKKELFKQLSA